MNKIGLILFMSLAACQQKIDLDEFQFEHVPSKPAECPSVLMSCHDSLAYDKLTGWADFPKGYLPESIQFYPTKEDIGNGDPDRCITLEPITVDNETVFFDLRGQPITVMWGFVDNVDELKKYRPDLIKCNTELRYRGAVNTPFRD